MYYLADSSAANNQGHNLEYMLRISEFFPEQPNFFVNLDCKVTGIEFIKVFRAKSWDFGRFGFPGKIYRKMQSINPKLPELLRIYLQIFVFKLARINFSYGKNELRSRQSKYFYEDLCAANIDFQPNDNLIFTSLNIRELDGLMAFMDERTSNGTPLPRISVILRNQTFESIGLIDWPLVIIHSLKAMNTLKRAQGKIIFYADTVQLTRYYSTFLKDPPTYLTAPGLSEKYGLLSKNSIFVVPSNSRIETRNQGENLAALRTNNSIHFLPSQLSSNEYATALARAAYLILPYVPDYYRFRSSGIFAEALSVNTRPIIPTGTWMSQEISNLRNEASDVHYSKVVTKRFSEQISIAPLQPVLIKLKAEEKKSAVRVTIDKKYSHHEFCEERNTDEFIYFIGSSGNINLNIAVNSTSLVLSIHEIPDSAFGFAYFPGQLINLIEYLEATYKVLEFAKPKSRSFLFSPRLTALKLLEG